MDHDHQPNDNVNDNAEGRVYAETFVFTGGNGQSFLQTMQNLMNRIVNGSQQQQRPEPQNDGHGEDHGDVDAQMTVDDPPLPVLPQDDDMPALEPLDDDDDDDDAQRSSRPIRPLPRPHAHFHAHTPNGIIDLFTFNVDGPSPPIPPPPPPPPGATTNMASFTFNIGADTLAGFEAFFLGTPGQKEREPDPMRARVLVEGMETVPEGLVRRLERAGGVPGGQGTEENAGCAVCWGPLLDEVEPGEWDTAKEKEEKAKSQDKTSAEVDELHGRIVALPCAHVYHAECLLPWFSRQTTCPTCRLDIDPESLTRTPRPPTMPDVPPPPQPHFVPPHPPPGNDAPHDAPHDAQPPHDQATPHDAMPTSPSLPQFIHPNTAEAARFAAFVTGVFRAIPEHRFRTQYHTNHPAPPNPPQQPQQPQAQFQQAQFQQAEPQPHQPQNPTQPTPMGAPLFPPPAQAHFFPMPMPMFVVPPFQTQAVPNSTSIPLFNPSDPLSNAEEPAPRKKWTSPEPVGRTLRQRVEAKERELGLRCDDVVCGVAPSDEDPVPNAAASQKRVSIHAAYDAHGKACEHAFHPACLLMSARVAGVEEDGGDEMGEGEVQVPCPACRAVGSLSRTEWDEGIRASEAEMA